MSHVYSASFVYSIRGTVESNPEFIKMLKAHNLHKDQGAFRRITKPNDPRIPNVTFIQKSLGGLLDKKR
ncbi:hypothetical protein L596_021874 [Steinernema carpocapsae]|uniref:Uncharacterized protein n=1 Tax=Steinernema carpocapsae TaxID=34508 RepID=A0A4U5MK41_STECR|nr:hypothetical protein L596_021874 [Steinernema carpocapsae]